LRLTDCWFHERLETCLNQCLPPSISLRAPVPRGLSIRVAHSCECVLNEEAMRFHDACSASADRLADLRGGRFLPQLVPCFHRATTSLATEPLTPLSRPRFFDGAFARIESSETPRPRSPCLREKNTASATRDAFHRRVIAPALSCERLAPPRIDLTTLPP